MKAKSFRKVNLGEILDFLNGKSIKPNGIGQYPVFGSNGIIGGSDKYLYKSALIIGRVGAYCGTINYSQNEFWPSDNTIVAKVKDDNCDIEYLYYHLKVMNLNNYAGGSAQPLLTQTTLKQIITEIPTLQKQKQIASILSAYDDLIENNSRRIRILEEMAHAIYREWFVEFRLPAVAGAPGVKLRKTTPEEKKAIGKDVIPEGWEVVRLGDVAQVNRSSINTKNAPDEIKYIDIASVEKGEIKNIQKLQFQDSPSRARRVVKHGDIIWSTVRPNRKSYALILNPIENLIVSTGFAVISAVNCPFTYLYGVVTTDKFTDYLSNNTTGAAYPAVNTDVILNALIVKPDEKILGKYDKMLSEIYSFQNILRQKNLNLRQTRDLLLPKLVSGEVEVKVNEMIVE
jgi:type I restriction enzyme, S subunit